ncbi:MAG: hypothetical protein PHE53_02390 [Thermoguttaceae bacterium]|nr:hypothetical protein [Thermoguttaceae bacterium]
MSETAIFSGDFSRIVDGFIPVTWHRGGGDSVPITRAIRTSYANDYLSNEKNAYRLTGMMQWQIPLSESGDPPRVGDLLEDGERGVWTVLYVKQRLDRWLLTTRNEKMSTLFEEIFTLEVPSFTKDASGAQLIAWQAFLTGVRGTVIPRVTSSDDKMQGNISVQILLLCENFSPKVHRLRNATENIFTVCSFQLPSHFPGLVELDAECERSL